MLPLFGSDFGDGEYTLARGPQRSEKIFLMYFGAVTGQLLAAGFSLQTRQRRQSAAKEENVFFLSHFAQLDKNITAQSVSQQQESSNDTAQP